MRLWTKLGTAWFYNDYSYTSFMSGTKAVLSSPTPSSALTSASSTFSWTAGANVTQYWLSVGTTLGGSDVVGQGTSTATSLVVPNLPFNGATIYVRLWSQIAGGWLYNDYTLTAVAGSKAVMSSPTAGGSLAGASDTFAWSAGNGASEYWLSVGKTVGGTEIYDKSVNLNLSAVVAGLPTDGRYIYVRLWTKFGNTWQSNDYTYSALLNGAKAVLTTPAPNATLSGGGTTFSWSTGTNVSQYWLSVGTTAGGSNVFNQSAGISTSLAVSNLPTNGGTVYVRLWSQIVGVWVYYDYTLTAVTGTKAVLAAPTPGSILTASAVTFSWNAGVGATGYWLSLGSAVGGTNIFDQSTGTNLSVAVSTLPTSGATVYVRLWTLLSGTWLYNDYTVASVTGSKAIMSSPAAGSTLPGASVIFSWSAGIAASEYWLSVGTTVGGSTLLNQSTGTNLSFTVSNAPTNALPVYVRLWTKLGASWVWNDYVYIAKNGP